MKKFPRTLVPAIVLMLLCHAAFANPKVGFFLPDSIQEMTMSFRSIRNLIVVPVRINDRVSLNLLLDTGCSNVVLFGRALFKHFQIEPGREILFSGLGAGKPVKGSVSVHNKVTIGSIIGHEVPVILVADKNLFTDFPTIDGIIGYDIFLKLEIEINSRERTLTFRPAQSASVQEGFTKVPLTVQGSKPFLKSAIKLPYNETAECDMIIDTGSCLGILIKTTSFDDFFIPGTKEVIGRGLNGYLSGYEMVAEKLTLSGFEMFKLPTGIVDSDWHNQASIGMDILKDYIVVLNYCQAYACFKPLS